MKTSSLTAAPKGGQLLFGESLVALGHISQKSCPLPCLVSSSPGISGLLEPKHIGHVIFGFLWSTAPTRDPHSLASPLSLGGKWEEEISQGGLS